MVQSEEITKKKALQYVKKISKNRLYHSDTIYKKLLERYNSSIAREVIEDLKKENFLKDEEYINRLISLYIVKGYGKYRFKRILYIKGISQENANLYSLRMEREAAKNAFRSAYNKCQKYPKEVKNKKIIDKLSYLGFSKETINYIIFKEG